MNRIAHVYNILRCTFVKYAFGSFEKIRLALYMLLAGMAMTILPLHFVGLVGISNPFLMTISFLVFMVCLVCLALFLCHKLHLATAFSITGISITLLENLGIIYMVVHNVPGLSHGVGINVVALGLLYILLCMALLYKTATLAAAVNLLVMGVGFYVRPGLLDVQFILVFVFMLLMFGVYSFFTSDVLRKSQRQSAKYRHRLDQIFEMFQMSNEEMVALVKVCRQNHTSKEIDRALLGKLSFRSRANLIRLADKLKAEKLSEADKYADLFQQLTQTEIDVCRLVVRGMSIKEIAQSMDKSLSNVSTVRGNIRRKLELDSSEDLRSYLIASLKKSRDYTSQLAVI